ncbi:hypothetical protein EDC96DRAFT_503427 [Choanephora cucurbitarum]|nr:hypothetical protein EDC96DRAFT_503427 [Choanephora cucurbitarum]
MTAVKSHNITLIPPEIWESVFRYLSSQNLFQCQKVCQAWHLPAQRVFLEHVFLKNQYDVEQFLQSFAAFKTKDPFNHVKRITIGRNYTMPSRARLSLASELMKQLVTQFPQIQQLVISGNCIDLTYFAKPNMLEAMLDHWPSLSVFRVDWVLVQFEKRKIYLDIIYQLRHRMTELTLYDHDYVTLAFGGPCQFLRQFPRLQHLKIIPQDSIDNMEKCLEVLEGCPQLISLDMYIQEEDREGFLDDYLKPKEWCQRLEIKENWSRIQSLDLNLGIFSVHAIGFIIEHFKGLHHWTVGLALDHVNTWTQQQRHLFSHSFLNRLCECTNYRLRPILIHYDEDDQFTRSILEKHLVASHNHLVIDLYNNQMEFGFDYNNAPANSRKYSIELVADKREHTVYMTHYFNQITERQISHLNERLFAKLQVNTLTLNMGGLFQFTEHVSVQQWMEHLPSVTQLNISLPIRCCYSDTLLQHKPIYPQITSVQLTAGHALWINKATFSQLAYSFPSLKYLSLWFCSGVWEDRTFLVDMVESNLERLHLDVTPVSIQTGKILTRPIYFHEAHFILKVSTKKGTVYYRVGLDYLQLEKIPACIEEEFITVHLKFQSIQYVNLYLNQEIFGELRPTLPMDPQKIVQRTVCLL